VKPKNRRISVPPEGVEGDGPRDRSPASADDRAEMLAEARTTGGKILAAARAFVGGALVLGLSLAVAWTARRHVLTSPRFAVTEVVVQGAHRRTVENVRAEAGVNTGMNIFSLDLDRARNKLLQDPWIETAVLARRLPGKVEIRVTERESSAVVALPEAYLATRDGRVFKRLEVGDPVDAPVVSGLTSEGLAEDREGVQRTIARALDLAAEYERAPMAPRAPLEEVHVGNGGELTLIVGKDGVSLALGLPPFRRKLEEAGRIFAELERRDTRPSVVMLDDEARPDRVVVRTR
jgi:cell division protein FtsQ